MGGLSAGNPRSAASITLMRKINSKLFIRNLSSSTTENELHTLFASSGTVVSVDIIKDRLTGRSKGYGFIQMSNPLEAQKAMDVFNGLNVGESEIRVVNFVQWREGLSASDKDRSSQPLKRGRNKRP